MLSRGLVELDPADAGAAVGGTKRAMARGNRASRPSGRSSRTGDQASGSTVNVWPGDLELGRRWGWRRRRARARASNSVTRSSGRRRRRLARSRWRSPRRQRGHGVVAGAVLQAEGRPAPRRRPTSPAHPRSGRAGPGPRTRCARRPPGSRRGPGTGSRSGRCPAGQRNGMPSVSHSRSKPERGALAAQAVVGVGRVVERHAEGLEAQAEVVERASRRCGRPTGRRCAPRASRSAPGKGTAWSITVTSGRSGPTTQAQYQMTPAGPRLG